MSLNVVCVLKVEADNYKRPIYNKSWVDKLYRAVKRNYSKNFNFVCCTNDIDQSDDYQVEPLSLNSWGWWNKLDLFAPNKFVGPTLFLDLDVVVCKDFTGTFDQLCKDKLFLCMEPYKNLPNSSVMYWNGDLSELYLEFVKNQQNITAKYQYPSNKNSAIGDGAFIAEQLKDRVKSLDNYVEDGFFNWKHHKVKTEIVDPTMLIFTSTEKPTNNLDLQIIKNNWI